jgi:superfamily II DNA or RNA helicase
LLQSYIGPVVFRLPSYELINEKKSATPVYINTVELKYLEQDKLKALYDMRAVSKKDDPTVGNKILDTECDVVRDNPLRLSYICNIIGQSTKNSLVIFSDVKNSYGKNVYNRLRETTKKKCFYIDGNTPVHIRQQMVNDMEADLTGNTIIIASIGCFSEGINIKNVWNIFLIETTKSDNALAQILGRGMRQFEGKERTMMIDFVDDFRYGEGFYEENYLYKHGRARQEIYARRGFPCNSISVDLTQFR